jgi:N-hydroxyarylamine O-acetyltransferase
MFDLSAYLARLDLPAPPAPDEAALLRMQRAHRLAIPFENLDVPLGRGIAIDGASVFAKLIGARRGGFCFEHNRLFGDALDALGFAQRPLLARVWLGATEPPPLTHTLSLVTVAGQDWIADAGFGGSYAPPLPLVDGMEGDAPDGARFRLEALVDGGWMLWREGPSATTDGRGAGPGWQRQYSFTLAEVFPADLAMGSHWAATAPGTRFTAHRIVSIVLPHGFASLTDRFYRRRAGETATEGAITDPRVYRMRLSMMFGIDLAAEDTDRLFTMG